MVLANLTKERLTQGRHALAPHKGRQHWHTWMMASNKTPFCRLAALTAVLVSKAAIAACFSRCDDWNR
jgi:hypothetical protein